MLVVGLVGGSGSGKGVVGGYFRERGYLIYDTDAVYHKMTAHRSACTEALADAFGSDILRADGSLDRTALAERVFAHSDAAVVARRRLNAIAHRYVKEAFVDFTAENPTAKILLDAPLLFEAQMDLLCDVTVAVTANRVVRIERIMSRDGISYKKAADRIDSQMSDSELIERCDFHIVNDTTTTELRQQTNTIINQIDERIKI